MNQGKIIEYIDQGRLICSLCLQDKGNRLHLLTPLNRQVNLAPKRAILSSNSSINAMSPREEILNKLKMIESRRDHLKEEINVKDLWELLKEEKESFGYKYLAQLCFGEMITDDHISALVRALFDDKLYFKMKDGQFIPLSEATVKKTIHQREEESRKADSLKKGSIWLKELLQGKSSADAPEHMDIIEILVDLALHGKDAPNFSFGKELLSRTGISDHREARTILIRLGVWDEDEAVDLLRLDIRKSFSEEQLIECEDFRTSEIDPTGREDLRLLPVFTVDGSMTRDFDDALTVEVDKEDILIGIHISDVADFIPKDSILDREALLRGSSLYLPRQQIPMFPEVLSHDTLSLIQGVDRPSISLLTRFDKAGNLLNYRFTAGIIRVDQQLTYDFVNEKLYQENLYSEIYELCKKLRQKRVEQGAMVLSLPEVSIRTGNGSSVSIEMISQEIPSRMIVAELMILYNWLAARFCKDNNIPVFYRRQKEPSERLSMDESDYYFYVFRQRRKLFPLEIDVEPGPHAGLGLDVYSNFTSPIRRYYDLVSQRQLKNFLLRGSVLYNRDELEKIRIEVEPSLKNLNIVKRNRLRYWIYKYFQQHIGDEFSALVLDVMKSRYRIIIEDFLIVAEIKRESGENFVPGKRIVVRIKKADPWNDQLSLECVGMD